MSSSVTPNLCFRQGLAVNVEHTNSAILALQKSSTLDLKAERQTSYTLKCALIHLPEAEVAMN